MNEKLIVISAKYYNNFKTSRIELKHANKSQINKIDKRCSVIVKVYINTTD